MLFKVFLLKKRAGAGEKLKTKEELKKDKFWPSVETENWQKDNKYKGLKGPEASNTLGRKTMQFWKQN